MLDEEREARPGAGTTPKARPGVPAWAAVPAAAVSTAMAAHLWSSQAAAGVELIA